MLLNEIRGSMPPDKIGISLAGLAKNNNGLFKSEKQARYLLSQCDEEKDGLKAYRTIGNVYGNSFNMLYLCDEKGVVRVEKTTDKKPTPVVTWERKEGGKQTVGEEKYIKQLERSVRKYERAIKKRLDDKSQYADNMNLYAVSMQNNLEALEDHKAQLEKVKSGITGTTFKKSKPLLSDEEINSIKKEISGGQSGSNDEEIKQLEDVIRKKEKSLKTLKTMGISDEDDQRMYDAIYAKVQKLYQQLESLKGR